MKRIRVLYIVPSLNQADGVSSYAMNYFREMKNTDIDFLITSSMERTPYCREVKKKGGRVFFIKSNEMKNILSTLRRVDRFFAKYGKMYDVVHCHVASLAVIYLHYAKKHGVKTRLLHAHATVSADSKLHEVRNDITSVFANRMTTNCVACSNAAGNALFKNREYKLIKNGIDVSRFEPNAKKRTELRESFDVIDKVVIGNIGRIARQKNQFFLIKIAKELLKSNNRFMFVVIGNGELEDELNQKIMDENLEDYFLLLGKRSDVPDLYNMMDVFVLPSFYEGFPVVGVEAQCNGLPCLFSNKITREVGISPNCKFIEIESENAPKKWGREILLSSGRIAPNDEVLVGYNIKNCAEEVEEYYRSIL